jgi:hypothetical protein
MKTLNRGILAALTVAAMASCDPYAKVDTGTPVVIGATASEDCGVDGCATAFEAPAPTAPSTAWTISGIASACTPATAGPPATPIINDVTSVFFVRFSKLLDGFSVQTSAADCTPAGNWLTVTPAAPAGQTWYACYDPSSPSPAEGSSVAIFRAPTAGGASGWDVANAVEASATVATTYHFAGSVKDKQGHTVAIDVTADVDPNPGVPGDPTYAYAAGPVVNVSWTAADCGGAATYVVERAPNAPTGTPPVDQAGTFAVVSPAGGVAGLTFADNTVTAATKYWYRVTGTTAGGVSGATSGETMATVP